MLAIEAAVWLLLARLALTFIPFPRLARHFGEFVSPAHARALRRERTPDLDVSHVAGEIGWAVTRTARYVPFKALCLPQAMAARMMLGRRGIASVMHFGAAKGRDTPFAHHAWLDAAGVEVTGFPVTEDFAEIACFV